MALECLLVSTTVCVCMYAFTVVPYHHRSPFCIVYSARSTHDGDAILLFFNALLLQLVLVFLFLKLKNITDFWLFSSVYINIQLAIAYIHTHTHTQRDSTKHITPNRCDAFKTCYVFASRMREYATRLKEQRNTHHTLVSAGQRAAWPQFKCQRGNQPVANSN